MAPPAPGQRREGQGPLEPPAALPFTPANGRPPTPRCCTAQEILHAKSTRPHFPGVILIFEMEGVAAPSLSIPQRRGAPAAPLPLPPVHTQGAPTRAPRAPRHSHVPTAAIFDGQHRVLAASTLLLNGAPDFVLHSEPRRALRGAPGCPRGGRRSHRGTRGPAEVYPTKSDDDVKRLFLEVNKAERVEEIDLPEALAPRAKKVIDDAVAVLEGKYAPMFKPSTRCRVPHVNREVLRNKLFNSALVDRRALSDSAQLVTILEVRGPRRGRTHPLPPPPPSRERPPPGASQDANTRLAAKPRDQWPPSLRGHRKLDKAAAHAFFLGMGWQWLDEL